VNCWHGFLSANSADLNVAQLMPNIEMCANLAELALKWQLKLLFLKAE